MAGLVLAWGLMATPGTGGADVILSPTSVFNNSLGEFSASFPATDMINQSGLSSGFVSGTTDFDSYIASNPTHLANSFDAWFSSIAPPGSFDLDLGAIYTVNRLALWNIGGDFGTNTNEFSVTTSLLSDFSVSTLVGTFAASDSGDPAPVQVFDLTDSTARYVRIEILSKHAGPGQNVVGLSEVAFAVPEPSTALLLAGGLLGLAAGRRRRQA